MVQRRHFPVREVDEVIGEVRSIGIPAEEIAEQRTIVLRSWATAPRTMHAVWLDGELGAPARAPHP
jgi:hypothetical protein